MHFNSRWKSTPVYVTEYWQCLGLLADKNFMIFCRCMTLDPLFPSLRKKLIFCNATTGFPAKWCWGTSIEIPYWQSITTNIWVVLLIGWSKFSANQENNLDLGSVMASMRNLCVCFSDVNCEKTTLMASQDVGHFLRLSFSLICT